MIGVGEEFPYFELQGVDCDNNMGTVTRDDFHSWKVFYFYPKDFTFICPTEIAGMDMLVSEADVCGFSGDNEFCKLAWKQSNDIIQNIDHTLAADCGLSLSEELEIVNEEAGVCYRATCYRATYCG